ncbi:MAG: hypothetical protein RR710_05715 [Oscillospiraceae bacterium]
MWKIFWGYFLKSKVKNLLPYPPDEYMSRLESKAIARLREEFDKCGK